MTLRELHVDGAWVVVFGNGLVGLWALSAHRWERLRSPALWWCTVVAQLAVFVQVGLGAAAMEVDDLEPAEFHMFYGFVAIFAIAILYSYRGQLRHRLFLLYGFGSLFVMGLGIRAMILVGA